MGTTIFDNAGIGTRGLVIGNGNGTTGTVTIAGGTLVIRNGTQVDSLFLGSPGNAGAGQGTLTLSGGNLIHTNANGNGNGILCVPFCGGSAIGGA